LLSRADDDHPGAAEVAVITFGAWKNYFGSDPNIVGKTVSVNKHPYTVVGVTPEGFYGTEKFLQAEIFLPMANQASLYGVDWLESRDQKMVFAIAARRNPQPRRIAIMARSRLFRKESPVEFSSRR